MKERIKTLLINGLKATEVASVVGCTPAYVSQLWHDADFKAEVEAGLMLANAEKTEEDHIDTRYQSLEHKLITAISDDLPNADFKDKLRALEVVGRRQNEKVKAKTPAVAAPTGNTNILIANIALPAHALEQRAPVVEVNAQNEIVAIDHRALAPMSAAGVKSIFAQMRGDKQAIEQLQAEVNNVLEEI